VADGGRGEEDVSHLENSDAWRGVAQNLAALRANEPEVREEIRPFRLESRQDERPPRNRRVGHRLGELGSRQLALHHEARDPRVPCRHRSADSRVAGPHGGCFRHVERLRLIAWSDRESGTLDQKPVGDERSRRLRRGGNAGDEGTRDNRQGPRREPDP